MNVLRFLIDIRSRENGVMASITRLQDGLNRTDNAVGRLNRRLAGLREAIYSLPGGQFFTNPIVAITAATGAVVKLGMETGRTEMAFQVLSGSMSRGTELLGQLNKYADDTIYGRSEIQEAAQTMLGFGVNINDVIGSVKMLGDVAMGNRQRFSQLALAYSQVAAAGRLQGQDLLQLVNAGYNPLLDISEMTGKSMLELRDEMSKGMISFDMMRDAFMRATSEGGRYHKMAENIARTPYGRFQQFLGDLSQKMLQLYEIIEPALLPIFDNMIKILDKAGDMLKIVSSTVDWVRRNLDYLIPVVSGVIAVWGAYNTLTFVSTNILKGWTIAQWAQVTAMIAAEKIQKLLNLAMWRSPITWVAVGIGALTAAVIYCWNKFAGFRAAVMATFDVVKSFGNIIMTFVIDRIKGMAAGIGSIGDALSKLFDGDFRGAWDSAVKGVDQITGYSAINNAFAAASDAVNSFGSNYDRYYKEQGEKMAKPKAAGGVLDNIMPQGDAVKENTGNPGSEEVITGGTRSTHITMNIGKFFDQLNVTMADKTDTAEMQRIVLECMNRSLEIATSTAR